MKTGSRNMKHLIWDYDIRTDQEFSQNTLFNWTMTVRSRIQPKQII